VDLPQLGSIASAVTRPDSCVDGPVCVLGSKNWPDSPGTLPVTGPSACQAPGVAELACWKAESVVNVERSGLWPFLPKSLPAFAARLSST
jgi:hypothetical protein